MVKALDREPDSWSDLALACLAEAIKADSVSPNPRVGALIVDDQRQILARGYHRGPGKDHAEVDAVKNYRREVGQDLTGKTIVVNLEPCSHFGRTPPCCDLLIEQGFSKVIIPFADPYHQVAGRGIDKLRASGVQVLEDFGKYKDLAAWINRGFLKAVRQKKPWLTLKMATTLDGKIADRFGGSRYVTGSGAREQVMDLRQSHDCVLVGKRTVLLDDPRLDVRRTNDMSIVESGTCKAVIDARLEIELSGNVFDPRFGPTILFYDRALKMDQDQSVREKLLERKKRHPDLKCLGVDKATAQNEDSELDLNKIMSCLYDLGLYQILCEGGSRLATSLLEADLVDQIVWFVAPTLIMDARALSVVAPDLHTGAKNEARAIRSIDQVQRFINCNVAKVGQDTRIDLLSGAHADLADCPGRLHLIK